MIRYLAMPLSTIEALLQRDSSRRVVAEFLDPLSKDFALRKTVLVANGMRAAHDAHGRIIALWMTDYLSATSDESWGILRVAGEFGLLEEPEVSREVFDRQLYVFGQRLQNLILEQAVIRREIEDNVYSCIAGRGTDTRRFRIAYCEATVSIDGSSTKAVASLGPAIENRTFQEAARGLYADLPSLARSAAKVFSEARSRPQAESKLAITLRNALSPRTAGAPAGTIPELRDVTDAIDAYKVLDYTYDDWMAADGPLTEHQRRIIEDAPINEQPVRIVGAAGSGKTLVMMLLVMRILRAAAELVLRKEIEGFRVLYVTHNLAMRERIEERFFTLGAGRFLLDEVVDVSLHVKTLYEYSVDVLGIPPETIISRDALETKQYQQAEVSSIVEEVLKAKRKMVTSSAYPLLSRVYSEPSLVPLVSDLVAQDISLAIKGHGLQQDRRRYVDSERRLSRLHGNLSPEERALVFDVYEQYHRTVFDGLGILDTDDVATSLLGRVRTPLWQMKRKAEGYDLVFVDEAQLFNENERQLLPLLTKGNQRHVRVVLAMDQGQQIYATATSGLGALGIEEVSDLALSSVHRSSPQILKLAFNVLQRTTDLFGPDFPDFTSTTTSVTDPSHPNAREPYLLRANTEDIGNAVARHVSDLRFQRYRHVAVVCHSDKYWEAVHEALNRKGREFVLLTERGQSIDIHRPAIVLARPDTVGGQEFDAVVCIGLEQGLAPIVVSGNEALSASLEQQTLREMYVSFTRAKHVICCLIAQDAAPNAFLKSALAAGLVSQAEPTQS